MSLSVVIITLNEESNIVDCIRSAKLISNDIIVVDSGSDDRTIELAKNFGARVFSVEWESYGASKNFGAWQAIHNWIFALDADERITAALAKSINHLHFDKVNMVYKFRRENYLGHKQIRFGTLGFEAVKRIYNRNITAWDLSLVHEKLVGHPVQFHLISGRLKHYGLKNYAAYQLKAIWYAQMSAEKYFAEGRKINWLKKFFSPVFNSVKSYIFQVGFLDGRPGFIIAKTTAQYSWLKYFYLRQLYSKEIFPTIKISAKAKIKAAS